VRRLCLVAVGAAFLAAGCMDSTAGPGWRAVGRSVEEREIRALVVGRAESAAIIFGAFHGDEPESAELAFRFAEYLWRNPEDARGRRVVIVPEVNPDGLASRKRTNANGVDINRNVAVSNWMPRGRKTRSFGGELPSSEPESRVVLRLMQRYRPEVVVSIHSIRSGRQCVNYDGPAKELAERMSKLCGYPAKGSIGYPTPGSFGTYAGKQLGVPTITLELPRGAAVGDIWEKCRLALLEAVRWRPRFPVRRAPGRGPGRDRLGR